MPAVPAAPAFTNKTFESELAVKPDDAISTSLPDPKRLVEVPAVAYVPVFNKSSIVLADAFNKKKIKRDDLIMISGVGAGFTFGSSVFRWY